MRQIRIFASGRSARMSAARASARGTLLIRMATTTSQPPRQDSMAIIRPAPPAPKTRTRLLFNSTPASASARTKPSTSVL